jgi:hypothetical protein
LSSNSVLPTAASPAPVAAGVDVLSVGAGVDVLAGGVDDVVLSPPHPAPNAANALIRAITIPNRSFDISHPFARSRWRDRIEPGNGVKGRAISGDLMLSGYRVTSDPFAW